MLKRSRSTWPATRQYRLEWRFLTHGYEDQDLIERLALSQRAGDPVPDLLMIVNS